MSGFQRSAFQDNAFQVADVIATGGHAKRAPRPDDFDDDELLLFAFDDDL